MNVLFPKFLKDDEEFIDSREYWTSLCAKLLTDNNRSEEWQPWFESESATRELSENFPICTLINLERSKGVIINQRDPEYHKKSATAAWIETYERKADEFWADEYLVFNCTLTEQNAEILKKLFSAWIQPDCGRMQMNTLIDALLP